MAEKEREPTKKDLIQAELEEVRAANGGLLHAKSVVDWARERPESALYTQFEWSDSDAAEKYRILQAQSVIRIHVTVVKEYRPPTRLYVSLSTDRTHGGGYRRVDDVLSDAQLRAVLLQDAFRDLSTWQRKYQGLQELSGIFAEIERARGERDSKDEAA